MRASIDHLTATGLCNALGMAIDNESDISKENSTIEWLYNVYHKVEISKGHIDLDPLDIAMLHQFVGTFTEFVTRDANCYSEAELCQARLAERFVSYITFPLQYHREYIETAIDCADWESEEVHDSLDGYDRHGIARASELNSQYNTDRTNEKRKY